MAPDAPAAPAAPDGPPQGKAFLTLLLVAAATGLVVSLAAWLFLEATHQTQVGVYDKLPEQLGYDSAPLWWPLPVCAIAGVITAAAIMHGEDARGVAGDHAPGVREAAPAPVAAEQHPARRGLERPQVHRCRRLADRAGVGGRGDRAPPLHLEQQPQPERAHALDSDVAHRGHPRPR